MRKWLAVLSAGDKLLRSFFGYMIIGDKHLKIENLKSNEGKSGYSKEGSAASPQWFPQEAALCIYSGTGDR